MRDFIDVLVMFNVNRSLNQQILRFSISIDLKLKTIIIVRLRFISSRDFFDVLVMFNVIRSLNQRILRFPIPVDLKLKAIIIFHLKVIRYLVI